MPAPSAPTNRQLEDVKLSDAYRRVAELIVSLETAGDRVIMAREAYELEVAHRDRLVWEANRAGLSQEVIGRLAGMHQPHVSRAMVRHRERVKEAAREAARAK